MQGEMGGRPKPFPLPLSYGIVRSRGQGLCRAAGPTAGPELAPVAIKVDEAGGVVYIEVEDKGPGRKT